MKKLISIVLVIVMLLALMPLTVFATTGTDGLVYELSDDGTYYIVSGYEGEATDVVIPSNYKGLPVKKIGYYAFNDCANIKNVKIPNSVIWIDDGAFCDCTSLTKVEIGNSVMTIGDSAFWNCKNLTSVEIPNSVTMIEDRAFLDCTSLSSLEIPDSVMTIGGEVFDGCNNLQFNAYNNAKYLGNERNPYHALIQASSSNITSCNLHENTKMIACAAFWYCTNLTSVEISNSVSTIGNSAFSDCTNLKSIKIPNSVTMIGSGAFSECTNLISIKIPDSVTTIGGYAFWNCKNLTSVEISNSVSTIDGYAFYNCINLTSIYIPSSVTTMGDRIFLVCDNMTDIYCEANSKPSGWDEYWNAGCNATVHWGYKPVPVKITAQPKNVSVQSGKVARVTVNATGEGLTYKWYFKNKGDSKFTLTNSYKSNTYSLEMNGTRAGRQVYCVITDKYGNEVKTNTVTLGMAVKITKQPTTVSAQSGKQAKVTVSASGEGKTYKWYYKDKGASKFTLTNSFKGDSYYIEMNGTRAGRQVYCVITDKYGNSVKTNTVTLGMAVKITKQPVSVKVANGSTAKVTVSASGEGKTYKWYFKDKGATKFSLTNSFKGATYSVTMTNARAGRQVYCVITDKYGNSVKTNTVTLNKK